MAEASDHHFEGFRRAGTAESRTFEEGRRGPWHDVKRRFDRGLLTDTEAIVRVRRALSDSLPTLEVPGPAALQCIRIVDRLGDSSPQARQSANVFRRWSDRAFPRVDEVLDYLEIDTRRLTYKDQYDTNTAWLRSRSRSAPLGLSITNRMSLLDLALEFGVPAAVGDSLRWRSGVRGGIAAPGLVWPALTEWAVRALFVLLGRRGTSLAALDEILIAMRDPLLAPVVARLATNTMLTEDVTRERVAEGVEALRHLLFESRDRWTTGEARAAEEAAVWLTDRLAATARSG